MDEPAPRRPGQRWWPAWLRPADVLTLSLGVAALSVLLEFSVAPTALRAIVVVLIGWPLVVIALQAGRWARQHDGRYVAVAVLLTTVATGSVWISTLLTR